LIIPLASVLASVVDFLIAFGVLLAMMVYYHLQPTANFKLTLTPGLWSLPLFLLLAMITALGVSLWLSALNVIYRDVGHVLPFITQLWFFLTPIVYSSREVSANWRLIYALNPMVGVVDGFRWALLGTRAPDPALVVSALAAVATLVSGLFYFRNMERTFADEI
jgi:lipopolysaccharide transport system permease protein